MWEQLNRIIKQNGAIVLFGSEPFSSALRMSNIKNYKYDWIWVKNQPSGHLNAKRMPLKNNENITVFYRKQPTYNPQFEEYSDKVKERFKNNEKVKRLNNTNNIYGKFKALDSGINYNKGTYPKTVKFFNTPPNSKGRLHPTQKPVLLMEYLIKTYTNEGETVLDFAMGSGSTGVAAKQTNRKFIGIEQDEKYFNIAQERINSTLF
jgi:site-specific DNA-methyltransferase (adenine-specific)